MPRKRIAESLTARIFLITAGILLFAGAVTFGFIAWATPSTYTAVVNDDLTAQVDDLVERLADTAPGNCGELLDEFVLASGANAVLVGPDGELVDTGAKLTVYTVYGDKGVAVTTAEGDTVVLITHDNSIAVRAKRIVRLQDGRIIYDGDASDPAAVVQPEETGADGEVGV